MRCAIPPTHTHPPSVLLPPTPHACHPHHAQPPIFIPSPRPPNRSACGSSRARGRTASSGAASLSRAGTSHVCWCLGVSVICRVMPCHVSLAQRPRSTPHLSDSIVPYSRSPPPSSHTPLTPHHPTAQPAHQTPPPPPTTTTFLTNDKQQGAAVLQDVARDARGPGRHRHAPEVSRGHRHGHLAQLCALGV
jgi:hypothetical protein